MSTGVVSSALILGFYGENMSFVSKFFRYDLSVCFLCVCATIAALQWIHTVWGMSLVFAGIGFFLTPVLPCALELGAESTYPVPEAISTGWLMAVGGVVGTAVSVAMSALQPEGDDMWRAEWLLAAVIACSAVTGVYMRFALYMASYPLLAQM